MISHATALSFSYIFTGITLLTLSILVFFKKQKTDLQHSFFLYSFSIAWWCLNNFFVINTNIKSIANIFNISCLLGVIFIPILFLKITYAICKKYKNNLVILLCFLLTVGFIISLLTGSFVKDLTPVKDILYFSQPNIGYRLFISFFFIVVVYCLIIFFLELQKESNSFRKKKLATLFIASSLGYTGGALQFLLVFRLPTSSFVAPIGVAMVGFYGLIIFYAIIKHKLLEIDFVIKKGLVYSLLLTIISLSYLIFVMILEQNIQQKIGYTSKNISIIVAFFVGIFIIPLRNRIQLIVDKLVFRGNSIEIAEENEKLRVEKQKHETVAALASGVAHEIRNPLTAIKAFCEHTRSKKDDPDFIDRFERVTCREIDRIEQLTQQLLDFAKPSAPDFQSVNINDVIEDTLLLTENGLKKNNIILDKNFDNNMPSIQADPNQLKQALLNLILNAIDAMDNGGTLTINTASNDDLVTLSISDTGCGIPADQLKKIFQPFHTNKNHGTGLGLSIVKTIIENHQGRISVDSIPNQGTAFKIGLPND